MPIFGSIPSICSMEPSERIWRSWSRKSARENVSVWILRWTSSAFALSIFSSAFSMNESMSHAHDARHNAVRMENLQGIVFFAHAHELNGLPGDVTDGESRAAARVTVQLGQNHARSSQPLVEFLGAAHGVLPNHGIRHQQHFTRPQSSA